MTEHHDRALLLIAAGQAAEVLERRVDEASGHTVTLAVDEARELAEQFARCVALLTVLHIEVATAAKRPPLRVA